MKFKSNLKTNKKVKLELNVGWWKSNVYIYLVVCVCVFLTEREGVFIFSFK